MVNHRGLFVGFITCLLVINSRCDNRIRYDVQFVNSTGYLLNDISLGWCYQDLTYISMDIDETSLVYSLYYEETLANFFGSGTFCVNIYSYSMDINNVIDCNWGGGIDRFYLDKDSINLLEISFINGPAGNLFEINKL